MSFWTYCCNQANYTSNPIDVGCGSPADPNFYHLKGRVLPIECEKTNWKSIGNYYAIDEDGSLWSIAGTDRAGVNYFNKGLPYRKNYCQVDDGNDWNEVIPGDNSDLFLKTDGTLYTLNNKIGLNIQDAFLQKANFPVNSNFGNYLDSQYSTGFFAPYDPAPTEFPYPDKFTLPQESGLLDVSITKIEAYDPVFGDSNPNIPWPAPTGLCYNKVTYSCNFGPLEAGDIIKITWDIPPTDVCGSGGSLWPSGYWCQNLLGGSTYISVHYKVSDNEFLTTSIITLSEITDLSRASTRIEGLNLNSKVNEYLKSFSSETFPTYTFDAPISRARISSKIKQYKIYESSSGDIKKNILDDLQFSRKPTLHVKYYYPSSFNIHTNDLDIDGFYHQCSNFLRDNNLHYYHDSNKSLETVEAIWKGKIDWIKITYPGSGYIEAPSVNFIPTDNEVIDSENLPQGIVEIDENGEISNIQLSNNPYVWNKPPTIEFINPSGFSGVSPNAVCEIIGPIQGLNVTTSGDGYTHAGTFASKLVLVAQADINDFYVHGIPDPIVPIASPTPTTTPSYSPTPSFTATKTQTPSVTPSITPSKSRTSTPTPTLSFSPTNTLTPTITSSPEPSFTPTPSMTVSNTNTPTITSSPTKTMIVSPTASVSSGPRVGSTPAILPSPTATSTPDPSPTKAPRFTATPSPSPTITITKTPSNTASPTPTTTLSPTPYSPTPTPSQTPSSSLTPTVTPTFTPSSSHTATPSVTASPPVTRTPTNSLTPSATSKIRKVKLKQWMIADVELYESEISKIELLRPLFGNLSISIKDSNDNNPVINSISGYIPLSSIGELDLSSELPIFYVNSWGQTRSSTDIIIAEFPLGMPIPNNAPFRTNINPIYTNRYNDANYLTPYKAIFIRLTDKIKDFLNKAFQHEHFTEAFIYGPGTRKEYITSGNIDNLFDYSEYNISAGEGGHMTFDLYVCMTKPPTSSLDPPEGYKYYYKINNFHTTINSTRPYTPVNQTFPNSKENIAHIYFPANSFGDGAIAKLNQCIGPSGHITCDSATIIKNNSYNTEPQGLLRTIGYDIPTRIGSLENNFNLDLKFTTATAAGGGYKCLGTDNNIYIADHGALYQEGGGVKFNFDTQIIPTSSIVSSINEFRPIYSPFSIANSNGSTGTITVLNASSGNFTYSIENNANLFINIYTKSTLFIDNTTNLPVTISCTTATPVTASNAMQNGPNVDLTISPSVGGDNQTLLGILVPTGSGMVTVQNSSYHLNYIVSPPDIGSIDAEVKINKFDFSPTNLYTGTISPSNNPLIFNCSDIPEKYIIPIITETCENFPDIEIRITRNYYYSLYYNELFDPAQIEAQSFQDSLIAAADADDVEGILNLFQAIENWSRLEIRRSSEYNTYYYNTIEYFTLILEFEYDFPGKSLLSTALFNTNLPLDNGKSKIGFGYYTDPEILNLGFEAALSQCNAPQSAEAINNDTYRFMNNFEPSEIGLSAHIIPYHINTLYSSSLALQDNKLLLLNNRLTTPMYKTIFYEAIPEDRGFTYAYKVLTDNGTPYLYIIDECDMSMKLTDFIDSMLLTGLNYTFGGISIPIDIIPDGDPVILPTYEGIAGTSMKRITGYLADSDYNYSTISGSLGFSCGCANSIIELPSLRYFVWQGWQGYLSNYTVAISNGGPTLNTQIKSGSLIDISNLETAITYQNYLTVNTDNLSMPIKGATSNDPVLLVDSVGKIRQIKTINVSIINNVYVYNEAEAYPIIPCELCNHIIINKTIQAIKNNTILTDDNQVYK